MSEAVDFTIELTDEEKATDDFCIGLVAKFPDKTVTSCSALSIIPIPKLRIQDMFLQLVTMKHDCFIFGGNFSLTESEKLCQKARDLFTSDKIPPNVYDILGLLGKETKFDPGPDPVCLGVQNGKAVNYRKKAEEPKVTAIH